MEKENTEDLLHPSMLQIRYLTELAKIGKKRGSVALIADTCGVSHGPVSRFLRSAWVWDISQMLMNLRKKERRRLRLIRGS